MSNSGTRVSRDSLICESCQAGHLRRRGALSRVKPTTSFMASTCERIGSMQGLTATPRRVNASRSLAFHLGSMSDSASSLLSTCLTDPSTPSGRLQLSPIRPVPPANGSPAPSYMMRCIPRGNPAGRPGYDPAIRRTQPSYSPPSHPFTPAPSPSSPRTWVWALSVDCGSRVACHCTRGPSLRSICYKSQLRGFGPLKPTPSPTSRTSAL